MSGVAYGLDFSSVMAIGAAQGADLEMLSDVLPGVEAILIDALSVDPDEE